MLNSHYTGENLKGSNFKIPTSKITCIKKVHNPEIKRTRTIVNTQINMSYTQINMSYQINREKIIRVAYFWGFQ